MLRLAAAPVKMGNKALDVVMGVLAGAGFGYIVNGLWGTFTGGLVGGGMAAFVGNVLRTLGGQLVRESINLAREFKGLDEDARGEVGQMLAEALSRGLSEMDLP